MKTIDESKASKKKKDKKKVSKDASSKVSTPIKANVDGSVKKKTSGAMFIEPLTFEKLNTGALLLGYVLTIDSSSAMISLPGGVTGIVEYQELSDVIYDACKGERQMKKKQDIPNIRELLKVKFYYPQIWKLHLVYSWMVKCLPCGLPRVTLHSNL